VLNSLTGTLTQKGRDTLLLATQGVEWEILTSATSLEELPDAGTEARVWVHLYHRENAMQLFGFATQEERALFLELLKVDGLGPRLALRVLSGIRAPDLLRAVRDRDTATLSRVPGVGPKTAEKLAIALAGKPILESAGEAPGDPLKRDLLGALTAMGFDRRDALRALEDALERHGRRGLARDALEKEALRDAIRLLGEGR
jgi:Holliday junction DNA helicase RuvA